MSSPNIFQRISQIPGLKPLAERLAGRAGRLTPTRGDAALAEQALPVSPATWAQLERLQFNTSRFLAGSGAGMRPSMRRKPSVDFREHRKYVPGDDFRFVDWKASARQEHIFLKQGENLRNMAVHILLDNSASMAWDSSLPGRSAPKHTAAIALAGMLSYIGLAHGDKVQVIPAWQAAPLGPLSGKGQFPAVLNYLHRLPFSISPGHEEGRLAESISPMVMQLLHRATTGGLVFIISDLLEVRSLAALLAGLPAPAWQVNILHLLHPEEISPKLRGRLELQDVETGERANYDVTDQAAAVYTQRSADWRAALALDCVQTHSLYTPVQSDWAPGEEMLPRLRAAQVVVPV